MSRYAFERQPSAPSAHTRLVACGCGGLKNAASKQCKRCRARACGAASLALGQRAAIQQPYPPLPYYPLP